MIKIFETGIVSVWMEIYSEKMEKGGFLGTTKITVTLNQENENYPLTNYSLKSFSL